MRAAKRPGRRGRAPANGRIHGAGFAARQRHALELAVGSRRAPRIRADFLVLGHDLRLAQVVTNLIDNACSFSEPGGDRPRCARENGDLRGRRAPEKWVVITVDDDGPGIPAARARTRSSSASTPTGPEQGFGQNSGLGPVDLASDRRGARREHLGREPPGNVAGSDDEATTRHGAGARFVVALPASFRERDAGGWTALHATALVVGESGVLLRGPSGAGKSSLALALIWAARERAVFAALIADDRAFARARRPPDRARRA